MTDEKPKPQWVHDPHTLIWRNRENGDQLHIRKEGPFWCIYLRKVGFMRHTDLMGDRIKVLEFWAEVEDFLKRQGVEI